MSPRITTGKLEPLGLVHRHQPNAVAPLFENRCFGGLAALRRLAQRLDEAAKRHAAFELVLPRQLRDVQHVGERLFSAGTEDEADMGACVIQQAR